MHSRSSGFKMPSTHFSGKFSLTLRWRLAAMRSRRRGHAHAPPASYFIISFIRFLFTDGLAGKPPSATPAWCAAKPAILKQSPDKRHFMGSRMPSTRRMRASPQALYGHGHKYGNYRLRLGTHAALYSPLHCAATVILKFSPRRLFTLYSLHTFL